MSLGRILIVEDDRRIVSFLQPGLRAEGYNVDIARDGIEGLELARRGDFALIVMDYMLPGLTGVEISTKLREEGCSSLILMLTARDGLQDKVAGLKGGADDYLTKPFAFAELLARIEAMLRRNRSPGPAPSTLNVADLTLNPVTKTVRRAGQPITLTPKEFALLDCLMRNAGTVVSRAMLLSHVWNMNLDPGTKVVDVYIGYLRRKVDPQGCQPLISTVRGFGYIISAEMSEPLP